jgi:hypothetical protein
VWEIAKKNKLKIFKNNKIEKLTKHIKMSSAKEFTSKCKHNENILMCEICEYGYSTPGYSDSSDFEEEVLVTRWEDKLDERELPPLRFKDKRLYSKNKYPKLDA